MNENIQKSPVEDRKPNKAVAKQSAPKWEIEARDRLKAAIKKYSKSLADLKERDANEADTRLFITDFLCDAFGLDKYKDLSTEYRVKGEYVDYGIRLDNDMIAFVEVKRLNTKLGPKHLRQVQSYALNEGVEWIILTNGAEWQIYHLSGGLPVSTDLVFMVDLLSELSIGQKSDALFSITREALKRGRLNELWQAKRATSPTSLATVLLSPAVVDAVRKELRKTTGYMVSDDEIQRLIRETCLRSECL